MAAHRLMNSPAMRKQALLVEFSGLKTACPQGIFVSLTPGDPTLWAGVIFVRTGPYSPAILRFQISFPNTYPVLPPLVTFSTDIFHPLLAPLTTQTYTTDIQTGGTVSATDEERLPPGGFSLRHGFPEWFGRGRRSAASSRQTSGQYSAQTSIKSPASSVSGTNTPSTHSSSPGQNSANAPKLASTYEVLRYIRSTFDDADVLDSVPLEAAGNPGAWHAWRAHRFDHPPTPPPKDDSIPWHDGLEVEAAPAIRAPRPIRKPGEWNWEGVWEVRVKKGIELSLSDAVLYGNPATNDELIRFLHVDDDQLETIKDNIKRSMESV